MENTPARVLIIDTAWLGDVLFTTALAGAVRCAWPHTEIDLLTSPRAEQLVEHHPDLRRVIVYDKQGRNRGVASLIGLSKRLNAEQYDVVLCAHPSFRSRLLCSLLQAPYRVGYRGWLSSFAFTHTIHNDLGIEPDHVERRLNLLRAVTPLKSSPPLRVGLGREETEWALNWLKNKNFSDTKMLALVPGSARRTKQWETERFQVLARKWLEIGGDRRVIVFLGPQEKGMSDGYQASDDNRIVVVEESLRKCAALLNRCQAAVGNDTGVSFLALASGCAKVLVLYGSTQVNYAFPAPHKAVAAGVPCCLPRTGHGEARCKWTNGPPWCMSELTVEKVFSELME